MSLDVFVCASCALLQVGDRLVDENTGRRETISCGQGRCETLFKKSCRSLKVSAFEDGQCIDAKAHRLEFMSQPETLNFVLSNLVRENPATGANSESQDAC